MDSNNPDNPTLALPEQTRANLTSGFTLSFWIYLFKDVVHENRQHNSYRTLVQSPGLFSLYLRPYDNSVVLIVPDPESESGVRYVRYSNSEGLTLMHSSFRKSIRGKNWYPCNGITLYSLSMPRQIVL